jgi:alpha-tubulin suppressor-like RCC1 family protein
MRLNIFRGTFKRYAIATFLATAALASFGSGSASAAVMGTLVTWGASFADNPPAGNNYVAVSSGGNVACWGLNSDNEVSDVPTGSGYTAISSGSYADLALAANGSIVGWGDNTYGEINYPSGTGYLGIAEGGFDGFAITANHEMVGWGNNDLGELNYPALTDYVQVSAGYQWACALTSSGTIVAWGTNTAGETNVPSGSDYVAVSAGVTGGLALTASGSVVSWGDTGGSIPSGTGYQAVSSGQFWNLFIDPDGTLSASGTNSFGEVSNVPAGNNFVAIAAGDNQGVAIEVPEPVTAGLMISAMAAFVFAYRPRRHGPEAKIDFR